MTSSVLPMVWLCGAPGTGKSTVAWQLLLDLQREGVLVGYIDIDQLGMVFPPPDGDADRYAVKVANLKAVLPNFSCAGAQVLIVSGVVDLDHGSQLAGDVDDFDVTFCHLAVEESVLRSRLAVRGWPPADADSAIEMMRALESADFITAAIDSTDRPPGNLATHIRHLVDPAPARPARRPPVHEDVPRGDITIVCGPRAVGKSSVSWGLFTDRVSTGRRTCYFDLEQISFLRPADTDLHPTSLRTSNLVSLWRSCAARGATALIANGMITDDTDVARLQESLHPAQVHVIRLSANSDAIHERIRHRHGGSRARLIGDDLEGASPEYQRNMLAVALGQERELSRAKLPDYVIDTTSMPIDAIVHHAARRLAGTDLPTTGALSAR